jgi:hypothetical protein
MKKRKSRAVVVFFLTQCHHHDASYFSGAAHGFQLMQRQRNSALAYRNHENPIDEERWASSISPTDVLNPPESSQYYLPGETSALTEHGSIPDVDSSTSFRVVRTHGNEKQYWNSLRQEVARSIIVLGIAALLCPSAFLLPESPPLLLTPLFREMLAAVGAAMPLIYLLPMSHQDWRLRQDSLFRLYGRNNEHRVFLFMGGLALARSVQDEMFFRLVLCGCIGAITGSPYLATCFSSAVYSSKQQNSSNNSWDRWFVEGLWYSGLLLTGTLSIPGLILTHFLVHWHWDAICWKHVVRQLRYVEAATTAETATSSDLHRFFLAHDSRHCGKLNAHDMRRALEYASQGKRIPSSCVDIIDVYKEFNYEEFEGMLRDLHKEGALHSSRPTKRAKLNDDVRR